jgi:hypothetical protein
MILRRSAITHNPQRDLNAAPATTDDVITTSLSAMAPSPCPYNTSRTVARIFKKLGINVMPFDATSKQHLLIFHNR